MTIRNTDLMQPNAPAAVDCATQYELKGPQPMLPHVLLDYHRIAPDLSHCKRLAIVGNQGAGKSTLAEKLGNLLGIEYVEWYPDQAAAFHERLARQERWVIDGAFPIINHADRVIFLDFPLVRQRHPAGGRMQRRSF